MALNKRFRRAACGALAAVAAAVSVAVHGCGSGGPATSGSAGTANVTVNVVNDANAPMGFSFQSPVTAHSGDVVRWSNGSSSVHGIVWDAQQPASSPSPGANIPTFGPGANSSTWTAPSVTAATAYNYHCSTHGPTMPGVINVLP